MNHKREFKRIAKHTFPSGQYSFYECRKHRKNLYNEMYSYWYNHPECSAEDIRHLFCEETISTEKIPSGVPRKVLFCLLGFGIIIVICLLLYLFSLSWDAPTLVM